MASLHTQSCRSLRKHQEEGEAGQVKGLTPGSQPQGEEEPPPCSPAGDPPQAWGTILTTAGHVSQTVQSSRPNDIPPKARRCSSSRLSRKKWEASGSWEACGDEAPEFGKH